MPSPSASYDLVDLVVASGQTTAFVAIGNPTELGLFVPTLTAGTLKVQVAQDAAGTGAADVYDGTGTQKLAYASGTGGFAISSNEMGACLGYGFLGVVCGVSQLATRTFKVARKLVGTDPTA